LTEATPHSVDMAAILFALVLILVGARLVGLLFEKLGQSAVLGELLAGVVLGNLGLLGFHGFDGFRDLPAIEVLAQIGVLFLLFRVGLETDLAKMAAVGASAFLVAVLGVVAPMVLGFFVTRALIADLHWLAAWFVGATLCATSVGITARVLTDLARSASTEGRIILGAAVIDDVLGLIVLAVVVGLLDAANQGRTFEAGSLLVILGKSVLFLAAAVLAGRWLAPRLFGFASRLQGEGLLLTGALAFCFLLSYLAAAAGLAAIVGAFAAGLVLDEAHYRDLRNHDRRKRDLTELTEPLAAFLVPVFFVLMGMRVDLAAFAQPGVPAFAAVLTLAAVAGKQVCSLGVLERGVDRLAVGLGMIPRGEVGLIFAGIGATLVVAGERVISPQVYSAVVVMVALTTLMTPPLLVWRLRAAKPSARGRRKMQRNEGPKGE
jgi:Kef-type K+ transport system membrane component KefB